MTAQKDIDQVVDFLQEHIAFFSAPFLKGSEFQVWAKRNESDIRALSKDMVNILKGRKHARFANAVSGNPPLKPGDEKNSLLHGNDGRIRKFLAENPESVSMFKKHMNEPVIYTWYKTQATEEQKKSGIRCKLKNIVRPVMIINNTWKMR